MTTPITRPANNLQIPFNSDGGNRNAVPVASSSTPGLASYTNGFPSSVFGPTGLPVNGKDFNGVLYDITSHTCFLGAGGRYRFDSVLAAAIGGYPVGFVLQSNDGLNEYVNVSDGNAIDFNSTPSAIGETWLPYAGIMPSQYPILNTGGPANVMTAVNSPALSAQPASGFIQVLSISTANTGSTTYAPDGLTAEPVLTIDGQALTGGELPTGGIATLMYESGAWFILSCIGVLPVKQATESIIGISANASQTEANAITVDNKTITPLKMGFGSAFSDTKLIAPEWLGSWKIERGGYNIPDIMDPHYNDTVITFEEAFVNPPFVIAMTDSSAQTVFFNVIACTNTSCTIRTTETDSTITGHNITWIAIGN